MFLPENLDEMEKINPVLAQRCREYKFRDTCYFLAMAICVLAIVVITIYKG